MQNKDFRQSPMRGAAKVWVLTAVAVVEDSVAVLPAGRLTSSHARETRLLSGSVERLLSSCDT